MPLVQEANLRTPGGRRPGVLFFLFLRKWTVYPVLSRRGLTPGIDPLLKDRGRLERDDATRRDRHFLTSLGIAADALAFHTCDEHAKRR